MIISKHKNSLCQNPSAVCKKMLLLTTLTFGCATSQQQSPHHFQAVHQQWAEPDPTAKVVSPPAQPLFEWPIDQAVILRKYDMRTNTRHEGMLLGAPHNTPVCAAAEGEVLFADDGDNPWGNVVMIRHPGSWVTLYGHLDAIKVKEGQQITSKTPIGTVGLSGDAESPQVYFEMHYDRKAVDPLRYLHR